MCTLALMVTFTTEIGVKDKAKSAILQSIENARITPPTAVDSDDMTIAN